MRNPFRYFNSSPEVIRLTVMMYIRYPLSLRQVEDLLFERGIDICHETVRFWRNRFGPMFASEIKKRRIHHRSFSRWRWHLDEVFVRINGEIHYLWRAVDHEGEVLEVFATKRRDRKGSALILEVRDEKVRSTSVDCDRSTSFIPGGNEGDWQCRQSDLRALAQQPSRKLTPTISTTRGCDGQIQGHQDPAEIRRCSRLDPQPFQPGPPPQSP